MALFASTTFAFSRKLNSFKQELLIETTKNCFKQANYDFFTTFQ